jgi:hypothetical protein
MKSAPELDSRFLRPAKSRLNTGIGGYEKHGRINGLQIPY